MRPDDISAARQMAADLGISVEEAEALESIGTVVHQRLLSDTDYRALQIMTQQELTDRVRTLIEIVIHDRDISLSARAKE
jgi:hypothetical protein